MQQHKQLGLCSLVASLLPVICWSLPSLTRGKRSTLLDDHHSYYGYKHLPKGITSLLYPSNIDAVVDDDVSLAEPDLITLLGKRSARSRIMRNFRSGKVTRCGLFKLFGFAFALNSRKASWLYFDDVNIWHLLFHANYLPSSCILTVNMGRPWFCDVSMSSESSANVIWMSLYCHHMKWLSQTLWFSTSEDCFHTSRGENTAESRTLIV